MYKKTFRSRNSRHASNVVYDSCFGFKMPHPKVNLAGVVKTAILNMTIHLLPPAKNTSRFSIFQRAGNIKTCLF